MTEENSDEWSSDTIASYIGTNLLSLFNYRYFNLFLTWVLFRTVVRPRGETTQSSLVNGAAVFSAAIINDYLNEEEITNGYAFSYGVLITSYIYPQFSQKPLLSLGLGLTSSFTGHYIIKNLNTEDVLSAALTIFTSYKISQHTSTNTAAILFPLTLTVTINYGTQFFDYILPIEEVRQARNTLSKYCDEAETTKKLTNLYTAIFNSQFAIHYMALYHSSDKKNNENQFRLYKDPLISVKPIMLNAMLNFLISSAWFRITQIAAETITNYHLKEFEGWLQTEFKSKYAFNENNFARISSSNSTITSYAGDFRNLASINAQMAKKVSILPKLALLPKSIWNSKEFAALTVTLLLLDQVKSYTSYHITREITSIEGELRFIYDQYSKIEQHDAQHHSILDHKNLLDFTKSRYAEKAKEIQKQNTKLALLEYTKSAINSLYWEDILPIVSIFFLKDIQNSATDILIHSNSAQYLIELPLTRLKDKSYYTRIQQSYSRLNSLYNFIANHPPQKLLTSQNGHILKIENLSFERIKGNAVQATISVPSLTLNKGRRYALSGPNGSGKSSLFSIITNSIDDTFKITSDNYTLVTPDYNNITIITQQHYCPLYIKPIDWFNNFGKTHSTAIEIIKLMQELNFYSTNVPEETYRAFLDTEHENLYKSLSGGQIAKIELMKLFLQERCSDLVLIDETIGTLDRSTKEIIHNEIKNQCSESTIIITHHLEPNSPCVPSYYGFFDEVIELKNNGTIYLTGVCQD